MKKLVSLLLAAALLLSLTSFALAEDAVKEIDVMVWYRDIDDLNFSEMPYYNDPEIGITAQSGVKRVFNLLKSAGHTHTPPPQQCHLHTHSIISCILFYTQSETPARGLREFSWPNCFFPCKTFPSVSLHFSFDSVY